jgi:serine O-acetyltransferase
MRRLEAPIADARRAAGGLDLRDMNASDGQEDVVVTTSAPIMSLADWRKYWRMDLNQYGNPSLLRQMRNPVLRWQRLLRTLEYLTNVRSDARWTIARYLVWWRFRSQSTRLGFSISPNSCGPGLYLPHWGTIVVNAYARLGARCAIHPGVTIGGVHEDAPQIGMDVLIDPGAKLWGSIRIGDGARLGANAVVTHSVPAGMVAFGVPARVRRPRRSDGGTVSPGLD